MQEDNHYPQQLESKKCEWKNTRKKEETEQRDKDREREKKA